ncbi:hypothetical protein [Clavibacter michiganensis]|uniref:hypothetical protein n=1 Tax=Clavibacter michiganensis TaxID=28447 RepID=UPI0015E205BC|nr:hypothetical protein [Clavibacter michiganensis]
MAREISIEEIEQLAQRALQNRMDAIKDLLHKRTALTRARSAVTEAELSARDAYSAAVTAGWTDAELRDYGLAEVAPIPTKQRRKAGTRKPRATPAVDPAPASTEDATTQPIEP